MQGCNTYTHFDSSHDEFYADAGTKLPLLNMSGTWAYAKIRDDFFVNFPFTSIAAAGSAAGHAKFCNNTTGGNGPMDNLPNSPGC
jgi:hypothetical protein